MTDRYTVGFVKAIDTAKGPGDYHVFIEADRGFKCHFSTSTLLEINQKNEDGIVFHPTQDPDVGVEIRRRSDHLVCDQPTAYILAFGTNNRRSFVFVVDSNYRITSVRMMFN
jgi:hypothetical protein